MSSRRKGSARKQPTKVVPALPARPDLIRVRNSRVHGRGVFALRRIRKGARIIEYLGDRVSHAEADLRYDEKDVTDNHTFLFIVDRGVVIDGGVNGNEARYINHSCDPNCESVVEDRRVFVEAVRTIEPDEELNYDYQIGRDKSDPPNIDEIFACRCGAASCRGSMLWPPRKRVAQAAAARAAAAAGRKATGRGKSKTKTKTKTKTKAKARGTATRAGKTSRRTGGHSGPRP